jgi:hypothetical protein
MQRSPGRYCDYPVIPAPPQLSPNLEAAPRSIPQRRDARGRFVREPGERSVFDRATGCERWIGPLRGNTPWDRGAAVLAVRWEAAHGPLPPGHRLVRICANRPRCVALDHAVELNAAQSALYRLVGREDVWLNQHEANEIHALVSEFAERHGISINAAAAYARWPVGLAEALPDAVDPA